MGQCLYGPGDHLTRRAGRRHRGAPAGGRGTRRRPAARPWPVTRAVADIEAGVRRTYRPASGRNRRRRHLFLGECLHGPGDHLTRRAVRRHRGQQLVDVVCGASLQHGPGDHLARRAAVENTAAKIITRFFFISSTHSHGGLSKFTATGRVGALARQVIYFNADVVSRTRKFRPSTTTQGQVLEHAVSLSLSLLPYPPRPAYGFAFEPTFPYAQTD